LSAQDVTYLLDYAASFLNVQETTPKTKSEKKHFDAIVTSQGFVHGRQTLTDILAKGKAKGAGKGKM
jgi:hypothetical protein